MKKKRSSPDIQQPAWCYRHGSAGHCPTLACEHAVSQTSPPAKATLVRTEQDKKKTSRNPDGPKTKSEHRPNHKMTGHPHCHHQPRLLSDSCFPANHSFSLPCFSVRFGKALKTIAPTSWQHPSEQSPVSLHSPSNHLQAQIL